MLSLAGELWRFGVPGQLRDYPLEGSVVAGQAVVWCLPANSWPWLGGADDLVVVGVGAAGCGQVGDRDGQRGCGGGCVHAEAGGRCGLGQERNEWCVDGPRGGEGDRDVHIPEGTTIGYDAEADRQRYFVTESGITVVTRDYSLFENPVTVDYFTSE